MFVVVMSSVAAGTDLDNRTTNILSRQPLTYCCCSRVSILLSGECRSKSDPTAAASRAIASHRIRQLDDSMLSMTADDRQRHFLRGI